MPECDSTKPTCDNCAKNPDECVYPVKLKPGLRPGTGTDMTKRIEQLEERVAAQEAMLAEHEARFASLAQPSQPQPQPPPQPTRSPSQWQSGPAFLSTPLPFPNPTPMISPDMPLDLGSFGTHASPGAGSTTSFLDPHLLPADEIVRDLIALYFSTIAPWAPIIRPQTFNPPWNITVYAIVVVTLRLSSDPRIASTKQQLRKAAKSHVISHAIESTSISSVQALALLALDLIGSEQGPSSWGILALLTRSAVHLGLITEDERSGKVPPHSLSRTSIIPPPADWGEDEARRRLFWLIFCLDRYACVSTGWDFALPDFEIKRRLPCSDELWAGSVSRERASAQRPRSGYWQAQGGADSRNGKRRPSSSPSCTGTSCPTPPNSARWRTSSRRSTSSGARTRSRRAPWSRTTRAKSSTART
jgi:hypothetical protein